MKFKAEAKTSDRAWSGGGGCVQATGRVSQEPTFWVRLAQELQGVGDGKNISLKAEVTRLKFPRFGVCFLELNSAVRISAAQCLR